MTSQNIGLRDAREEIGDIANRAYISGTVTYLTRNGKRVAAVAPLTRIVEGSGLTLTVPDDEDGKWASIAVLSMMRRLADGIVGLTTGGTVEWITDDVAAALRDLTNADGEVSDAVADAAGALYRLLDQAINQAR